MRRLGLMIFVLILLVGCTIAPVKQGTFESGDEEEQAAQEEISTNLIVGMKDKQFNQTSIKIKRGGTVTWVNEDTRLYFFTIYYRNVYPNGDVQIEKIPTGGIAEGEEFSYTFEKIGEYKIVPMEHGQMRGIVVVE